MSNKKKLLFLVLENNFRGEEKIEAFSVWEGARKRFIKCADAWEVKIYEEGEEETEPYSLICEISKKSARFGGIDCILIRRIVGKRKYKEHQLCETLDEVPEDIRPLLFKLKE